MLRAPVVSPLKYICGKYEYHTFQHCELLLLAYINCVQILRSSKDRIFGKMVKDVLAFWIQVPGSFCPRCLEERCARPTTMFERDLCVKGCNSLKHYITAIIVKI